MQIKDEFTIIIGSAFGDDTVTIYCVYGKDAEHACDLAKAINYEHTDSVRSVLYCMSGIVKFNPTHFGPEVGSYTPKVIDLRTLQDSFEDPLA